MGMLKRIVLILLILAGGYLGSRYSPAEDKQPAEAGITASTTVIYVIDGDTFKVNTDGHEETVRLIGIDTPEVDPTRGGIECYGKEASAFTASLIENKTIRLEADPTQADRDKYGRLLRYAFLEDGTNLNEQLVRKGYAREFTYDAPYRYQDKFRLAQTSARNEDGGLWQCD
jgi:micrococcal nuclease